MSELEIYVFILCFIGGCLLGGVTVFLLIAFDKNVVTLKPDDEVVSQAYLEKLQLTEKKYIEEIGLEDDDA